MINWERFSVQVLNGSGVTGAAAQQRDILKSAGFAAADVGNAPAEIKTGTISKKDSVPAEVYAKVKESVAAYVFIEGETLTKDSKYDLVIVLGSDKK